MDIQKTLELMKSAQKAPLPADEMMKAAGWEQSGSATTGITAYDLEAPAKLLYPILTPLRNKIPRRVGGKGIQANWKAITGINTTRMPAGVAQGKRSGAITHTTTDYLAAFRGVGLEDFVNFEAEYAAESFDDVKARAVTGLLQATMISEEFLDLGGNTSVALGTAGTPTLADVATGGTLLPNQAYNVRVVALTLSGYMQVAGAANGTVNDAVAIAAADIQRTLVRTNMDGTTDTINLGTSQVSAQAQVTTANDGNSTHSIRASVAVKEGAVAYAWFWGANGSDVLLGAVTTTNSTLITATATGTQNVTDFTTSAADNSTDSLVYDGILTQIMKSGSGAYIKNMDTGTPGVGTDLTSDGSGGIVEIDEAFASFWNNYRLSPNIMYVPSTVLLDMNDLIISNGGAPLIRYNLDGKSPGGQIDAGVVVGSYLNKITNQYVKIVVHPNMPAGMILFWSDGVPYPLSGIGEIVVKKLRRDYYQIEWPLQTRRYEYGVYFDGVLQNYFPPAFGVIKNIARNA